MFYLWGFSTPKYLASKNIQYFIGQELGKKYFIDISLIHLFLQKKLKKTLANNKKLIKVNLTLIHLHSLTGSSFIPNA